MVVLAGCGSSGANLLSPQQSQQLRAELVQVDHALAAGNCLQAADALSTFQHDLGELPGVNTTLVSNLRQGASVTEQLAAEKCPTGTDIASGADSTTTATTTRTRTSGSTDTSTDTIASQTTTSAPAPSTVQSTPEGGGSGSGGVAPGVTTASPPAATVPQTASTPESGGAGLGGTPPAGGANSQ